MRRIEKVNVFLLLCAFVHLMIAGHSIAQGDWYAIANIMLAGIMLAMASIDTRRP